MQENALLSEGGVLITATRAVFGSTSYVVRNLTSVRSSSKKDPATAALIALVIGFSVLAVNPIFGVPILAIGAYAMWKRKTTYEVVLATAGGDSVAFKSGDEAQVRRIISALNSAISGQGSQ